MSLFGFFNMFFFQLFFVRLAKCYMLIEGEKVNLTWRLMYWVIPFTGWSSPYKFIGECKYFNLTSK